MKLLEEIILLEIRRLVSSANICSHSYVKTEQFSVTAFATEGPVAL